MNSGNLTGNGGAEKASVVIESQTGLKTSTTLTGGEYDRVYTHNKDSNPADGDDEITITGGTYSAVEIHQTGSDTVSITGANTTVGAVQNANDNANFGIEDAKVTSVLDADGQSVSVENLSSVNINFNNVTVGSTEEGGDYYHCQQRSCHDWRCAVS